MYTIRGLRGLGAFSDTLTMPSGGAGAAIRQDLKSAGTRVSQTLANSTARITNNAEASRIIAEANAASQSAAAQRRAQIEEQEGGTCRALAEQFLAQAQASGLSPLPPIESLMNECLMTGPEQFDARLQSMGVDTSQAAASQSFFQQYKMPIIGVGVGLAALAAFSLFR